ncbi:MAG TPA: hypothetical protein VMZ28_05305 [Kofleriaceae bacterium]|nr:hypothetical protein [Kofleriaceae bacterium]
MKPRARRASTEPSAAGTTPSPRYLELVQSSRRALEETFLRGSMPDLDALVGWEFRGANNPQFIMRRLGIGKFIKGFERRDDAVYGYNRPVAQNPLTEAWIPRPRRFGWYLVAPVDPTARDNAYLHAALLDYGRGGNRVIDPTRGLRDYLVQVDAGNHDLYLGKAYYAVGPARVVANFFVLERLRPAQI